MGALVRDGEAKVIKAWRKRCGITQRGAAELLGVPLTTFQGWEQGRSMRHVDLLHVAMADIENNLCGVMAKHRSG